MEIIAVPLSGVKGDFFMKQNKGRKLLSFLLTLAMVVGLMPGMGGVCRLGH